MAIGEMNCAGVADEESPRLKSDSTRRRQCHRERERERGVRTAGDLYRERYLVAQTRSILYFTILHDYMCTYMDKRKIDV